MEDNKPRLSKKQIVYLVTAIAVLSLFFGLVCSSNPVQQPEESSTATTDPPLVTSTSTEAEPIEETLSEEERNLIIKSTIDQTVSDWESGIIDYEEASTILSEIQDTCNPELADYAQAQQEYLAVENNGNTLLELAQKFLGVKNYVQVLTNLNEIEQLTLWGSSVGLILISFFLFDRANFMTLAASLIGTTSLIFNAKGNPIGQALMIVFSVLYGVISYTFSYFGEMITYLGMTGPMALFALISWLRNPFKGNRAEVAVNRIGKREYAGMYLLTVVVTVGFYFILDHFNTANMIPSTLSVTTSFIAVYLTFRRSPYFALAYAANDVVLIVMWTMAAVEDISYLSVIICFVMFLVNDLYGFVSWKRMEKRQLNMA